MRRTLGCFLSPKLCKALIMLAKGKAPKVLAAASRKTCGSRSHTWSRGAFLLVTAGSVTRPLRAGSWKDSTFFVKDLVACQFLCWIPKVCQ